MLSVHILFEVNLKDKDDPGGWNHSLFGQTVPRVFVSAHSLPDRRFTLKAFRAYGPGRITTEKHFPFEDSAHLNWESAVHRSGTRLETRQTPPELFSAHLGAVFSCRVSGCAFSPRVAGGSDMGLMDFLAGDPGIEPGTFGSGDQRSLH